MGLMPLQEEELSLPPHEDIFRRQLSASQEDSPPETKSASTLILDFLVSRTVRKFISVV